jgi:septum formation protein
MKIILASSSPRRAEILRGAQIPFAVRSAAIDETPLPNEPAPAMVARLAEEKARAAAALLPSDDQDCIVIGADTTVELNGEILGKPEDSAHAHEMLLKLSGQTHRVLTGIFLLRLPEKISRSAVEISSVTFASLSDDEIAEYASSPEPLGKAGGYAIQERAGRFIPKIEGCYFNIVGLPLARVYELLKELGWREHER